MFQEWTSFERVRAAIEHREADRITFNLGGTTITGINKNLSSAILSPMRSSLFCQSTFRTRFTPINFLSTLIWSIVKNQISSFSSSPSVI